MTQTHFILYNKPSLVIIKRFILNLKIKTDTSLSIIKSILNFDKLLACNFRKN